MVRNFAWRQETVILKKMLRHTKEARASAMTKWAAARVLPQDVIPAIKPRSRRPRKTSKHTDDVRRQELRRDHQLIAPELKKMH